MPRSHSNTGRNRYGPSFVSVPWYLLDCRAWQALSLPGRAAYMALARLYNGRNNGRLAMSARKLSTLLRVSKDTAARALKENVAKGFAEVAQGSSFDWKARRA